MFGFGKREQTLRFDTATVSECGPVRSVNQDAALTVPETGCFAVADGMGGGSEGDRASRMVCDTLRPVFEDASLALDARRDAILDRLAKLNADIRAYANDKNYKTMGSTVAALCLESVDGGRALTCHAGDSRVYQLRGGKFRRLTRDHTVGTELSRTIDLAHLEPTLTDRKNPLSHVLTCAVGMGDDFAPQWRPADVRAGDRFLLCSDGVHDVLDDLLLGATLNGAASPAIAAVILRNAVLRAGANDNFTIVTCFVRRADF